MPFDQPPRRKPGKTDIAFANVVIVLVNGLLGYGSSIVASTLLGRDTSPLLAAFFAVIWVILLVHVAPTRK